MFLLYNFLSFIALLAYFPWLLFKKGPEKRWVFLTERLGISNYKKADIWVHAVSVGEALACIPFLKALKKEFPQDRIVLSTTTYTGQKIARERFPDADRIMYIPWDSTPCIKKVVWQLRPKIFVTIDTELWPSLFNELRNIHSHIILLNGRISSKSFKGYQKISFFMKKVLSYVDFLYMQGQSDAERIISLGVSSEKVGVMGNFKFDAELPKFQGSAAWINAFNGQIWVAGSTHNGEEEIILDAYEMIKKSINNLKLILAPRHPERFSEVEEILKKRNLSFIRRSETRAQSTEHRAQTTELPDIIFLDTIGELSQLFSKADVAFIGGSLLPFGGHNILEPAYWGNPIIFGPHMENFPFAQDFLAQNAAIMVKDSKDMTVAVESLLNDPETAKTMGQKAKSIVDNNRGAVKKAIDLVRSFYGTS